MLKVEVTTLGRGLNIVLGEGRVLRPRVKASCSIINSGKIKHSWVKLNKMTVGHDKKETSRALLFPSFSLWYNLMAIPRSPVTVSDFDREG